MLRRSAFSTGKRSMKPARCTSAPVEMTTSTVLSSALNVVGASEAVRVSSCFSIGVSVVRVGAVAIVLGLRVGIGSDVRIHALDALPSRGDGLFPAHQLGIEGQLDGLQLL